MTWKFFYEEIKIFSIWQIVETEFLRNSQGLTGYAYIRFADPQSVENALVLGNGTLLDKPVQIKKSNLKSMRISKSKYPSQETAGKDNNNLQLTTSKPLVCSSYLDY